MRKLGYSVDRSRGKGSHILLAHPNRDTLIVPNTNALGRGILRKLIRDAGISRNEFISLIN